VNKENIKLLQSVMVPGGALLATALVLDLAGNAISGAVVQFFQLSAFCAALFLAFRFRLGRILLTLLTLLLANRAVEFFMAANPATAGPGRIAIEVVSLLVAANYLILCAFEGQPFSLGSMAPGLALIFFESVLVAVLCRPGATSSPAIFRAAPFGLSFLAPLPFPALALCTATFAYLVGRFWIKRKLLEGGLAWSLLAAFCSLHAGRSSRAAAAYMGTAALMIAASIVESSYRLAYHDELTSLPGRRAFNEAVLHLDHPFVVAAVDIDHFKSFNDTYGHDIGDHVLRMVAGKLAQVTGGGAAYRVGGEEFTVLFQGKGVHEVVPHLEILRTTIESSNFSVRGGAERRTEARGTDRRKKASARARRAPKKTAARTSRTNALTVTVSIGAAASKSENANWVNVVEEADKALYRAKAAGRNRVEAGLAGTGRTTRRVRSAAT
jgi:diguanylate cyclase (GGDEF)-like protein